MKSLRRPRKPGAFLRAVAVLAGGTAIGQLVTLAASPVLSRLFDPESFGVLAVYTAILGITIAIGSLRLEQAIGLPRSEQVAFNVLTLAVLTSCVSAMVVGILAVVAPGWIFQKDSTDVPALVIWLIPIGIVFGSLYQALSVWALRTRAFKPLATTRIAQGVGTAAVQIGAGLLGLGAVGLPAGHAFGQSVGAGTLILRTVRGRAVRRPRRRELRAALQRYRRFPLLATPAALLNSASLQVPVFVLASAFGVAATGQYFLAVRITMAPLDLIGRSIGQVFYADAIAIGRDRPAVLRRLVIATSAKSFLIGSLPGLFIVLFAPTLFPLVFGDEWVEAGQFSQAMAVMLMANFAVSPVSQIFLIVERQYFSVLVNVAKLLTALAGTLIPVSVGLPALAVILVYSCAMAAYYLAVLLTAVLMLTAMQDRSRPAEAE